MSYRFPLFKIFNYKRYLFNVQRFCHKSSNLSQMFESEVCNRMSSNSVNNVLSQTNDFSINIDEFCEFNQNLSHKNVHFWSLLINFLITKNDWPKLSKSLVDYLLLYKHNHTNSTLISVLKLLTTDERYDDSKEIYDFILHRINPMEHKVLFPFLLRYISRTPYWKEGLQYIDIWKDDQPHIFHRLLLSAIKFDSSSIIQEFLDTHSELITGIDEGIFKYLFAKAEYMSENETLQIFAKIIKVIKKQQKILNEASIKFIIDIFKNDRICQNCNNKLPSPDLSGFNFPIMAKEFYELMIKGDSNDQLYVNTTIEELESIENFLSVQDGPFDCVIDFLNVLHNGGAVIEHEHAKHRIYKIMRLLNKDYNVRRICLVSKGFKVIRDKAFKREIRKLGNSIGISVFDLIVETDSNDDLFAIYLALRSGSRCYLLSNDLFRQHQVMTNLKLKHELHQWLGIRQIKMGYSENRLLQGPHSCVSEIYGDLDHGWHIPYENIRDGYATQILWSCLKRIS